jgi:hypothetical protein
MVAPRGYRVRFSSQSRSIQVLNEAPKWSIGGKAINRDQLLPKDGRQANRW